MLTPTLRAGFVSLAFAAAVAAAASAAPQITDVEPAYGPQTGGTSVTVHGSGFTGATGVTIGGVSVGSFVVVDDTKITGTTAGGPSGPQDVTVIGGGGATLVAGFTYCGQSSTYSGILFPEGDVSFADVLLKFDPLYQGGPGPTHANFIDPLKAIGPPDYSGGNGGTGAVSLGNGGLIELGFSDNLLTNSGDAAHDLHIFEVGSQVEDSFVAIRPADAATAAIATALGTDANLDGFFEIGKVFGSVSSIDIDAHFPGQASGTLRFDAVQLVDDPSEGSSTGTTVGADIDAVGAIAALTHALKYGAGCPGSGGFVPDLTLEGCAIPVGNVKLSISAGLGGATSVLFFGLSEVHLPMVSGCFLLADPAFSVVLPSMGGVGAGAGTTAFDALIPAGVPPIDVFFQAFVIDGGATFGFANSNGVKLAIQ